MPKRHPSRTDKGVVIIWRDSVAMGDDIDAPHEWSMCLEPNAPVARLVRNILRADYLASVAGGRATWTVEGRQPVAVIAQQWTEPRWLVDPALPISTVRLSEGRPCFKVRYWSQDDPQQVYSRLRASAVLLDRRGR